MTGLGVCAAFAKPALSASDIPLHCLARSAIGFTCVCPVVASLTKFRNPCLQQLGEAAAVGPGAGTGAGAWAAAASAWNLRHDNYYAFTDQSHYSNMNPMDHVNRTEAIRHKLVATDNSPSDDPSRHRTPSSHTYIAGVES